MLTNSFAVISISVFFLFLTYFFSLYKLKLSSFSSYDIQKYFESGNKSNGQSSTQHHYTQDAIVSLGIGRIMVNTLFLAIVFWLFCLKQQMPTVNISYNLAIVTIFCLILLWLMDIILPSLVWTHSKTKISIFGVYFVRISLTILYPMVFLINLLKRNIEDRKSEEADEETAAEFEEEFRTLIDEGEKKGIFEKYEGSLFHSMVEFSETIVREVMTPRLDIVAIEASESLATLIQRIIDNGYSRIPVYIDRIDNIEGIVFAKDLLTQWGKNEKDINLSELLREAYFIPETKKITQLLKEFQINKIHMAIVVDEYGGVSGLVTIEDLLEEIVGEIRDEYDDEVDLLQELDDRSVKVDARLNVEDLEEYFDVTIPRSDFDTVGGLIFHILGRVPKEGEEITYNDLIMKILKAEERRVRTIHISSKKEFEQQTDADE